MLLKVWWDSGAGDAYFQFWNRLGLSQTPSEYLYSSLHEWTIVFWLLTIGAVCYFSGRGKIRGWSMVMCSLVLGALLSHLLWP